MNKVLGLLVVLLIVTGVADAAQDSYVVTVVSEPVGGGTVDGVGAYPDGVSVSLTAQPSLGFRFVGWSEDGDLISTDPQLKFSATRDRELVAWFEPLPLETKIGGRWNASLQVIPTIAFQTSCLETYFYQTNEAFAGDIRVTETFTSSGWTGSDVRANIRLGDWRASTGITFDPTVAAYKSSYFSTNWELFDIYWTLRANHYAVGGGTSGPYLLYTLSARTDFLSVTLRADQTDCCLAFHDALININSCGLSLCKDIPIRASLALAEDTGFSYLQLTAHDRIWDGVSIDMNIKFTTTSKEVSVTPRWTGWGDANFRLYGNIDWHDGTFDGIELYGFKIRCCFDCGSCPRSRISAPYVEFLTGFNPAHVPGGFQGDEFEYWKAGFCGPASCCTHEFYSVEITAYFSHSSVGLFDLSRLMIKGYFPLFPGFSWEWGGKLNSFGDDHSFNLGWRWEF